MERSFVLLFGLLGRDIPFPVDLLLLKPFLLSLSLRKCRRLITVQDPGPLSAWAHQR